MSDIVVALGLVLVIEGLLWALAPRAAQNLAEMARDIPEQHLKAYGWAAVCAGAFLVWAIRG